MGEWASKRASECASKEANEPAAIGWPISMDMHSHLKGREDSQEGVLVGHVVCGRGLCAAADP